MPNKKSASKTEASTTGNQGQRRSSRAPKPVVKLTRENADDPDNFPGDGDDSVADGRKRTRADLKQPVLKLPRINETTKSSSGTRSSASSSRTTPAPTSSVSNNRTLAKPTPAPVPNPDPFVDISNDEMEDCSDTDTEDEDWKTPDYKDNEWFFRESRRCQTCNETYARVAEASLCVTSHKSLRCYFCFKVYSTTDILFKHFRRRHKQASREATLICPFCDQAIPYRSVSCHVINVHLRTRSETVRKAGSSPTVDTDNDEEMEASDTDAEDEDWETPDYKDKEWFSRESRRCQACNTSYDNGRDAVFCMSSHKSLLRCYFCFKVYSTTDILFKHYRRRHKQASREATLICPFCDQAIPYKSVACHFMNAHLPTKAEAGHKAGFSKNPTANTPKSNGARNSRRRTISRSKSSEKVPSSSNEGNPAKTLKRSGAGTAEAHDNNKEKKCTQVKLRKMKEPTKRTTTTSNTPEGVLKAPEFKSVYGKAEAQTLQLDNQGLRRSSRAPKHVIKLSKENADDPDCILGDGQKSGTDTDDKKRTRKNLKQPDLKLPRINEAAKTSSGPGPSLSSLAPTSSFSRNGLPARNTPVLTVDIDDEEMEDSGTDTEDEDWETPDFKDKAWFSRESRRCQTCNKSYDNAAEACLCVSSHQSQRCYFCFKVYSTTDVLFKHFRRRHKQAGREATLICPFCDQVIPYKSVSCHVINVHLRTRPETVRKAGSSKTSVPNTPKTNGVRKSIRSAGAKKLK